MDKRFSRMTESGTRLTFVVMLLFAAVTWVQVHWAAGLAELVLVGLLYLYYRQRTKRRAAEIRKYVENLAFSVDDASKHSMVNFPLPMAILRVDTGEIIWCNDYFTQISGKKDTLFETHITDVLHGFDTRWIMEGKTLCPYDVELGEQKYQVYGNMVRSGRNRGSALLATLFWVDITEYSRLRDYVERTRPAVGLIVIDSYEELMKNASEAEKSTLTADIDRYINDWAKPAQGIVRRLQRDRYLFIFEQHSLLEFTAGKFSILETIHQVQNSEGLSATLSIGVGKGECSLQELYQYAALGIDMALSRGGDQAVVKSKTAFEFYGGRSKELEKRTKVKSRVMANTLAELIRDSSKVLVMGHRFADLDSVGSAVGVCCLARKCGVKANIVIDLDRNASHQLIDRLRREPEDKEAFIDCDEAMLMADGRTLLVVVDTNRPEQVEDPNLLEACNRVAVIDHHRVAATYIHNAALGFIEPYASSVCELMTEILQEVAEQSDILRCEAEAMLSGIVLDTKSFTIRTGERTFDAAAYLRRAGADTTDVKRLLQTDMADTVARYKILQSAELYRKVAIAAPKMPQDRVVAAQAADELLNISGVDASIVIAPDGKGGTFASARSIGELNVQIIMEKLGGGGNRSAAAAQFPLCDLNTAVKKVYAAIDEYLDK